jgi:hypothetical protein
VTTLGDGMQPVFFMALLNPIGLIQARRLIVSVYVEYFYKWHTQKPTATPWRG